MKAHQWTQKEKEVMREKMLAYYASRKGKEKMKEITEHIKKYWTKEKRAEHSAHMKKVFAAKKKTK